MNILFNCHQSILIKHNFSCLTKFHLWNIIVIMVNYLESVFIVGQHEMKTEK